jgi:hypothetical protein
MATPISRHGQNGWQHDEGHDCGYFHTYDALQLDPGDRPRKIHVFLPHDHDFSDRHYPVIYMNDGNTAFWAGGLSPDSWEVPRILSQLYQQRLIPPIIIVAIHPIDRNYEYLHVQEFYAPFKKQGGRLADYAAYVARLKEFIDRSYKTVSDRKATTILGSSHGGLAAFYIGAVHGKHFGNVAAMSPSFWVGGVYNLRKTPLIAEVGRYLVPENGDRPRIWIDWGLRRDGGFHNFFVEQQATRWGRKMVELLQQDYGYVLGQDLFRYEDRQGSHDEKTWSDRLGAVLKQFYAPVHV